MFYISLLPSKVTPLMNHSKGLLNLSKPRFVTCVSYNDTVSLALFFIFKKGYLYLKEGGRTQCRYPLKKGRRLGGTIKDTALLCDSYVRYSVSPNEEQEDEESEVRSLEPLYSS